MEVWNIFSLLIRFSEVIALFALTLNREPLNAELEWASLINEPF